MLQHALLYENDVGREPLTDFVFPDVAEPGTSTGLAQTVSVM